MVGGRLATVLVFVCIFFYAWSFVNDPVIWPDDDRFRLLAADTLLAATDSVYEAMLSLLEAHRDEPRNATGTKFGRLQASLDSLHRNISPKELSGPRSVKWRRIAGLQHIDVCGSLAGKRITMIGGEHIYRLHLHLLRDRERAEKKPFVCPYHEFCTHHHICLRRQHVRDDTPPPRYIKPPTARELVETRSAVVNYLVSDTLLSVANESSWEYTSPFLDPMTGIRLRETHWLAAARKANVVILGRGPLSAPGQTYAGNWSFLRQAPDYVDESRAVIAGGYKDGDDDGSVPRPLQVINAAVHLTVSRFLPDMLQLLESVQQEVRPGGQKRLIWPGSWYRLPGRGAARTALLRARVQPRVLDVAPRGFFRGHRRRSSADHTALALQLSALIHADVTNAGSLEDPWTLLFNAQVYLQNAVLRELLPRYGIVFLPLDVSWAGDAWARSRGNLRGAADVDLERTTAIGDAFLAGMDYVLGYLE